MVVAAVIVAVAGLVVTEVGRRGRDGRLGRNPWAGIRTKATMASDEAWDAAHRAGGRAMVASGVITVVGGVAAAVAALAGSELTAGIVLGATMVAVLAGVVVSGIQGDRAAARCRSSSDRDVSPRQMPGGSRR